MSCDLATGCQVGPFVHSASLLRSIRPRNRPIHTVPPVPKARLTGDDLRHNSQDRHAAPIGWRAFSLQRNSSPIG